MSPNIVIHFFRYAGDIPKAHKLAIDETYVVEMPELTVSEKALDEDGWGGEEIDEILVKVACDPYVLESNAYFRYKIILNDWWGRMPVIAVLRLWVLTGLGERESHELYMRYGNNL